MRGFYLFFGFSLLLLVSFLGANQTESHERVYVVYMGAARTASGAPRSDHAELLSMLKKRKNNSVVHSYDKGFSGFAARLSEEEAQSIARRPGVVSVFPDRNLKLHTTRSWDFLESLSGKNNDSTPSCPSTVGADIIIGILDTGIWPESESFNDSGMDSVPASWKGPCNGGNNFTCNKKVVGARFYTDSDPNNTQYAITSSRDLEGHGTYGASLAAGRSVQMASYYGLARGIAKGCAEPSRIAAYAVCQKDGRCPQIGILKAFDNAIEDGVSLMVVSFGYLAGTTDIDTDVIAIGSFHSVENNILVISSAGNEGPFPQTVVNAAPWMMTVGAGTIDRDLVTIIELGSPTFKAIPGGGINFSRLNKKAVYPLVDPTLSASNQSDVTNAGNCTQGSLDPNKVKGAIVVCDNKDENDGLVTKFQMLTKLGVIGLIAIDNNLRQQSLKFDTHPIAIVTEEVGAQIRNYIKSTGNPTATILPTREITTNKTRAPVVAYFSSRGPTAGIPNLIKPDITAPGENIIGAWPSNDKSVTVGTQSPNFNIKSGTSVASPLVAAIVANVKGLHPNWSPAAIKSALMTTAVPTDNSYDNIMTYEGSKATPLDCGAGMVNPLGALQPGLVYDIETIDYFHFLCSMGYNTSVIQTISSNVPKNYTCDKKSGHDWISQMNYPSMAVSDLEVNQSMTVKRTASNVGKKDSTYTVTVNAPAGVKVQVVPETLQFTENVNKQSFNVTFTPTGPSQEDIFGSITWLSGNYSVRSTFAVSMRKEKKLPE